MDLVRAGARVGELSAAELVWLGEQVEVLGVRDMVRAAGVTSDGKPLVRTEEHGGGLAVISEAVASPYFNRAFGLGQHGPVELDLLDRLDSLYRSLTPVSLVQVHDAEDTPAVRERAAALGWQSAAGWVKMVRDDDEPPFVRTDLRIDSLRPQHAEAMGEIIVEAFHMPPGAIAALAGGLIAEPHWHVYGAFDGDGLAAVGALAMYGEAGYIAVGATSASHRNRGAQGALMARRLRDGAALGARIFVTETGMETPEEPNPSYHNMVRLGFTLAYHRADYAIA